ncbi:MAG: metal-dependent transcriptional regulator [Ruminococcus sp.]|nr:metal-dependent transcriptional regulator [Ruminococcus sp.]
MSEQTKDTKVHASGEDYLEAILMISERQFGTVRSVDVAKELGVTKPSVSNAMKILKNGGYITVEDNGLIRLTEAGSEIAERTYEKHKVLTRWLEFLGVDSKTAAEDACKIEHVISKESFDKLKLHLSEVHGLKIGD